MITFLQRGAFSLLLIAAVLCNATKLQGQISVGLSGSPANPFTNAPLPASEWATTQLIGGDPNTYATPESVDLGAQSFDESMITAALPTTLANAQSGIAKHNLNQTYLFTQAANVRLVPLKATLRNTSGDHITSMIVSYDFGVASPGQAETAPGHRVFFSLTGKTNTWQLIPAFSGLTNSTHVQATLSLGVWTNNSIMYLLWLDDNAAINQDGIYSIDNFAVDAVELATPSALTLTNSPQSLTVAERAPATFEVVVGGHQRAYYWFSNNVPVPGNNQPTFTIPSAAYPTNHLAQIHVLVSNAVMVVTSAVATLTVIQDTVPPTVVRAIGHSDQTTVTLSFSETLRPDTIDPSNFILYRTGSDPGMTFLSMTDAVLNNGSNVVLTTAARAPETKYSMLIFNVRDNSSGQNLINPNPTDLVLRQQFLPVDFDVNNIWKYSTQALINMGWETVGYDDSGWLSGSAGLGADTAGNGVPIRTTTAYAFGEQPQFFRRHFHLPTDTNGLVLTIRHLFDDGGIVFLNGREAGRYNVGGTTLTTLTRATSMQLDPAPISAPVVVPVTNLHRGDNVIAVVVVQATFSTSDIEMALELTAETDHFDPTIRAAFNPATSEITITWSGGTLVETTQLLDSGTVWTDVPGNPTSPYNFTPAPGTQRFFALRL